MASLLPGLESTPEEVDLAGCIPIAVGTRFVANFVPGSTQRGRDIGPPDEVVLESEREMILDPGRLQLLLLTLDEDVVADDVVLAVMLMESSRLGAAHQVVLEDYPSAAFIGVKRPATVAM